MQESQKIVKLENGELVYGKAEEVDFYCYQKDTKIEVEYTHITPAVIHKNFKYIGDSIHTPYAISKSITY